MIAIDTNALVRLVIEDNPVQSQTIQNVVLQAEKNNIRIVVLSEVLVETVWALEAIYEINRKEISTFIDKLVSTSPFVLPDVDVIRDATKVYENKGDFADLVIVFQAMKHQATTLFSFDKKLQKTFPAFVKDKIDEWKQPDRKS
jgi:predicted nucleic-acid-binding protein